MNEKSYIFGTGKPVADDQQREPVSEKPAKQGGGFAMPDISAMEADAPAEDAAPDLTDLDLANGPDLRVVEDADGYDPYDTQSLPALSEKDIFPASPAIGLANGSSAEPSPWETQVIPEDLCVTEFAEDLDPYNTTGRFEARNIWRKILRK